MKLHPRINIEEINLLIDDIECLSDLEKTFYKTIIKERKERILDYSVNKLKERT